MQECRSPKFRSSAESGLRRAGKWMRYTVHHTVMIVGWATPSPSPAMSMALHGGPLTAHPHTLYMASNSHPKSCKFWPWTDGHCWHMHIPYNSSPPPPLSLLSWIDDWWGQECAKAICAVYFPSLSFRSTMQWKALCFLDNFTTCLPSLISNLIGHRHPQ